jgi:signal transduction histidine kinase
MSLHDGEMQLRVLLVDDDEDELVLTRALLQQIRTRRVSLDWASTYEAGLERIGRAEHHLYLIDYRLGPRDGLELVREALARGCSRPIVLLTGHGEADIDLEALRAGAADYLNKGDLTPALLERSLLYALERMHATDARAQLEVARFNEEFQKQVLAIVGHDLRNPLSAMFIALKTIERGADLTERYRATVGRALSSCRRMERIISDLTDYTELRVGRGLVLHRVATSIDTVCAELLDEMSRAFPGRVVHYLGRGSPEGHWDAPRVAQLLGNLLSNAFKYSPEDAPVELRWWREPARLTVEDDLLVQVHNGGEAIPPTLMARIFEPFKPVEQQQTRQPRSLGLGLFIVKQIVDAHDGNIEVVSTPQAGTRITVRLPSASAPPD